MKKKMKIYVLTLSKVFPTTHSRKGEPTDFKEKVLAAINSYGGWMKYHTIRANYELWKKRFEEIDAGRACLCIRQWTGKPYASKQVEIARLTREDGIGLQKLSFDKDRDGCILYKFFDIDGRFADIKDVANNEGLTFEAGAEWADKHPDAVSMAYLQSWYLSSIDETIPPIWTDKHLEELFDDFYLVPKNV